MADAAAKEARDAQQDETKHFPSFERLRDERPLYIRIYTDGSVSEGEAAPACVVFGAWKAQKISTQEPADHWSSYCGTIADAGDVCHLVMPEWHLLMTKSRYLGRSTITNADLVGLEEACAFLSSIP